MAHVTSLPGGATEVMAIKTQEKYGDLEGEAETAVPHEEESNPTSCDPSEPLLGKGGAPGEETPPPEYQQTGPTKFGHWLKEEVDETTLWLIGSSIALLLLLILATVYYHFTEKWSLSDSWYFAVVTLTTVGYGVLTPSTDLNKVVTMIYIALSVTAGSIAVGTLTATAITSMLESADEAIDKLLTSDEKHPGTMSAAISQAWISLRRYRIVNIIVTFVFLLLGSGLLCALEGWSFLDSMYFSLVTMSTTGYGDLNPQEHNRVLVSFYILLSTGLFAFAIAGLLAAFVSKAKRDSARRFMRGALTPQKLALMDADGNGDVDINEFRVFMLTRLGFVEDEIMQEIDAAFRSLDADNSGVLNKEDLIGVSFSKTLQDQVKTKG